MYAHTAGNRSMLPVFQQTVRTTQQSLNHRAASRSSALDIPRATIPPAMGKTLLHKVWDAHSVRTLPNGQTQLFVGLHLIHEVTTPQAFDMLRARGWGVAFPDRTIATVDHIVPTSDQRRPFIDVMAEEMLSSLERNCRDYGIRLLDLSSGMQGIVHVIGPELGLTQPGMTIACGDSHTSTHGAFGAIAFGSARLRCATCSRRSASRWIR